MVSRRSRVQEKRMTRRAVLLFFSSLLLLVLLIFFGIPALARFAAFIGILQSSSVPILQEDKTPPAPPYVNALPKYVQDPKVTLTGAAEAGSTLKVSINGQKVKEIVVGDTSSFSIDLTLPQGENRIMVSATDKAGNESQASGVTVFYDTEPPALEITSPQDGQEFFANDKSISIEGKTETDAKVSINDRIAIVDGEGNFSQTVTLSEGDNTFNVKATDEAGNETEKQLTVKYTP